MYKKKITHHKSAEIFVKSMHPWVLPWQGGQVRRGPVTAEAQTIGCDDEAGGAWGCASWMPVRGDGQRSRGGNHLGGPVAKTLCSQCRGPRFHPWPGN